jgi:hypothetical protein
MSKIRLSPDERSKPLSKLGLYPTKRSDFSLPIGSDFSLPIGSDFSLPIGSDFSLPIGSDFVCMK